MKFEKDYINQNKLRPEEAEEYWCENCCNYDRGQYEKGYIDGAKAFGARLKGIFEESGINDKGAIDYLLRRIECDHYKQYGDEHMCDCGSECQQAVTSAPGTSNIHSRCGKAFAKNVNSLRSDRTVFAHSTSFVHEEVLRLVQIV